MGVRLCSRPCVGSIPRAPPLFLIRRGGVNYDRRPTRTAAAKIDLFENWSAIVQKVRQIKYDAFTKLLQKLVAPLRSVGYDLDMGRSSLDVRIHGSDGSRMEGYLSLKTRPGTPPRTKGEVQELLYSVLGMTGYIKETPEGWDADLSE